MSGNEEDDNWIKETIIATEGVFKIEFILNL